MRIIRFSLLVVLAAVTVTVLYVAIQLALRLNDDLSLTADSVGFQILQADADLNILVLGDDAGVGTGAALTSASVAGRIAQRYPCANIVNRARDGAMARDVSAQVNGTGDTHFNLALVQTGFNDILHFTAPGDLRRALIAALNRARAKADHVVLMTPGNVSAAPIFVPLFDRFYTRRAWEDRQVFISAARMARVEYVDLFNKPANDPLARDPWRFYASDGLHPNERGYAAWYRALIDKARAKSMLEC